MFGKNKARIKELERQVQRLEEEIISDVIDDRDRHWGGGVYPSIKGDVKLIKEYLGIDTEYQPGKVATVKKIKKGKK